MCDRCIIANRKRSELVELLQKWEPKLTANSAFAPGMDHDKFDNTLKEFDKDTTSLIKFYSERMARAARIPQCTSEVGKLENKMATSQSLIYNVRQDLKPRDTTSRGNNGPRLYKQFKQLVQICIDFLDLAVKFEHKTTPVLHLLM